MLYKLKLDDHSFFIVDENYQLNLFWLCWKKTISVKDYLIYNKRLKKYYLVDYKDNTYIRRSFSIEEFENKENYPLDTRLKFSQDIQVNDLLVGNDLLPRRVNELHTGKDEMFEINVNDKSYIVNGGHILELVDKQTKDHLEIPVNIYMYMDDEFKSHYAMEKLEDY